MCLECLRNTPKSISSFLDPKAILVALFSGARNLLSAPKLRGRFSYPTKESDKLLCSSYSFGILGRPHSTCMPSPFSLLHFSAITLGDLYMSRGCSLCKIRHKFVQYLIKHHAMKTYGGLAPQLHPFLISTLDGGE
jgi:hypothetical protein